MACSAVLVYQAFASGIPETLFAVAECNQDATTTTRNGPESAGGKLGVTPNTEERA
jgi:hypothetical protein